jgi:beta-lactamase class A
MASTFKIPILATFFTQLSEGKFSLDKRIALKQEDKSMGSGILPYFEAGVQPTILDLATLMMIISDNTATDMVIDFVGGPQVIEDYMHALGLNNIYFKLNCKALLKALFPDHLSDLPVEEIRAWSDQNDILRDGLAFSRESDNDVSTANDMNKLLHKIYSGELFDGDAKKTALDILFKQQFNTRLSRFLPNGTKVAHKTGTIGGIRNDSGIIYISDSNHVILTLFTEWDEAPYWNKPEEHHQRVFEVETAMGKIGRRVFDTYQSS